MRQLLLAAMAIAALAIPRLGIAEEPSAPMRHASHLVMQSVWHPTPTSRKSLLVRTGGYVDLNGVAWGNICYLPPNGGNWCAMPVYGITGTVCTCFVNGYQFRGLIGT